MRKTVIDSAEVPDEDNPEWTRADFRTARPALEVIAEVFGPDASASLARPRGRPSNPDRKVNQTLRLDADVVEAYRQTGPGWQARMNAVLRAHRPGTP